MKDTECHDCHTDTLPLEAGERCEFYMVDNELWNTAVPDDPHDMTFFLCIGCLEARLGRRLVSSDFADCPMNDLARVDSDRYAWSWRTPRLIERLSAA